MSLSRSRVRVPPSLSDVAQMVEQAFHQPLVAGTCARSSVVEQPPFKRFVVGSIPTGHTRYPRRKHRNELKGTPWRMPKELYGTKPGKVERVQLPSLPAPRWQTRCPFSAGRASHLFLHPLSLGRQIFGCSSAVERLTVNQDVAGSIPASRARNERKISGGMPVGVHRLKRTAGRPLANPLSPGPKDTHSECRWNYSNQLVAGSNPAIAFSNVAQLVEQLKMLHLPLVAVTDV